jgi:hypothetical protein
MFAALLVLALFLGPRARPRPPRPRPLPPRPPDVVAAVPLLPASGGLSVGSLIIKEDVVRGADDLVAVPCMYCGVVCCDVNYHAFVCLKPVGISDLHSVSYREGSCSDGFRLGRDPCRPCCCWEAVAIPTQLSWSGEECVLPKL